MFEWKQSRTFYQISNSEKKQQLFFTSNEFMDEVNNEQHIKNMRRKLPITKGLCGSVGLLACAYIYSIIRQFKPDIVVETGIDRGVTTTFILSALAKNGKGKLISVDIRANVGQLIPQELKVNWEQKVGKTSNILPILDVDLIDIFLHDSLHTYSNMLFEFQWTYPKLKDNGLLLSHDIGTNNSIYDFAKEVGKEVQYLPTAKNRYGVGIIAKQNISPKLPSNYSFFSKEDFF